MAFFEFEDDVIGFEFGRHAIDLRPILGGPFGADVSTTVFGGGSSLPYEVAGMVETGDSVMIMIIPRMTHGGLSLRGRFRGDSMVGQWTQNAYCCGSAGRFVMQRRRWTPEDDDSVRTALRRMKQEVRTAKSLRKAWEKKAGRVRVRTFDVAVNAYIKAGYDILRDAKNPEDFLMTGIISGPRGWGDFSHEEPGTYRVKLFSYICGDKEFYPDSASAGQVTPHVLIVPSGAKVQADLRIDTRHIRINTFNDDPPRSCWQ
jgi:hypothetical protein